MVLTKDEIAAVLDEIEAERAEAEEAVWAEWAAQDAADEVRRELTLAEYRANGASTFYAS